MEDRRIKVLLIEDNPRDVHLIREILAEARDSIFDLECAAQLSIGLERLAAGGMDVVLLDLNLPDSQGLDTFAKAHAQAPGVPILVLTGLDDEMLGVEAVKGGAQDYLVKGQVDSNLLARSMRYAIERERVEEELKQSFEKLRRVLDGTVHALTSAVEMRDPYTAGHQRRVTELACAIAKEMGLPEEQIEGIRMAGLIHDIGKVNIPAEILSKPGPLNDIEFSLIQTHPQVGHDILNGAIEFPWPVAEIVLQHHERMDGSGYPQGLSGDDILLEARILGVADVVEAVSSHRPYRAAHGIDEALEEISQNRGVLYDPQVVDACLKVFTEKGFKFE